MPRTGRSGFRPASCCQVVTSHMAGGWVVRRREGGSHFVHRQEGRFGQLICPSSPQLSHPIGAVELRSSMDVGRRRGGRLLCGDGGGVENAFIFWSQRGGPTWPSYVSTAPLIDQPRDNARVSWTMGRHGDTASCLNGEFHKSKSPVVGRFFEQL